MFNLQKQRLLVIAPHPDDEVLGCGGLIQKVKQNRGKVFVLFLAVGDTHDYSRKGDSTVTERTQETKRVASYLKIDRYTIVFVGDKYHLKLDTYGQFQVMHQIEQASIVAIEKIKPTMITFPSMYSYNQDHVAVAKAAHAALRPSEMHSKHFIRNVLAFEVPADGWGMQEQRLPNFYLPLSPKELRVKSRALRMYTSQYRPQPNPRSAEAIEALASLRGTQCQSPYAEAYHVYRIAV
jgi:LmbE family N-acetylglucosaminyl deacetylase